MRNCFIYRFHENYSELCVRFYICSSDRWSYGMYDKQLEINIHQITTFISNGAYPVPTIIKYRRTDCLAF